MQYHLLVSCFREGGGIDTTVSNDYISLHLAQRPRFILEEYDTLQM